MGVKFDYKDVIKNMDKELGEAKSSRVQNKALNSGALVVADSLVNHFKQYVGTKYSTGETAKEVSIMRSRKSTLGRQAHVGWNGPKNRWRLVHLNEWGYTRNGKKYRPRMMNTISTSVSDSEPKYYKTIYEELRKGYV